jgi:hypothetical protein
MRTSTLRQKPRARRGTGGAGWMAGKAEAGVVEVGVAEVLMRV